MPEEQKGPPARWLNRTVLGIGLASLCSDWAHETATTLLPAFLATLNVAAAWLGLIEGVSDGLSSVAKMASGFATDRLARRKPVAVVGYLVTALGTACFGLATSAWHVLLARAGAWLGRGVRTPVRKAILAGSVTPATYGRAFGFERMMDTVGAIAGPATALALLPLARGNYRAVFALTLVPGVTAALLIAFVVKEKERAPVPHISLGASVRAMPARYRKLLAAACSAREISPTPCCCCWPRRNWRRPWAWRAPARPRPPSTFCTMSFPPAPRWRPGGWRIVSTKAASWPPAMAWPCSWRWGWFSCR